MPLSLNPDYFKALEPLMPILSKAPKLPVGDVQGRRNALDALLGPLAAQLPDAPGVTETTYQIAAKDGHQVPLHHFQPKDQPTGPTSAILYIHGGGLICMDVAMYAGGLKLLAADTHVPIFAVDYRLSPEVQYPVALDEAWAALNHLYDNAGTYGIDSTRIAIMGDSAGGGLAACLALRARDEKLSPPLAKQILYYPMLDNTTVKPIPDLEPYLTWTYDDNLTGWQAYLGDKHTGPVSQYAAAARATSLAGLPPTYIDLGELDIFRDEDLEYARRLAAENISVELHVYPGVPHAFELFGSQIDLAKQAYANRKRAVMSF